MFSAELKKSELGLAGEAEFSAGCCLKWKI